MVESEASELSEDIMLGAVMFGHNAYQAVITGIIELAQATAKEPDLPETPAGVADVAAKVRDMAEADLRVAYGEKEKSCARKRLERLKQKLLKPSQRKRTLRAFGSLVLLKILKKTLFAGTFSIQVCALMAGIRKLSPHS